MRFFMSLQSNIVCPCMQSNMVIKLCYSHANSRTTPSSSPSGSRRDLGLILTTDENSPHENTSVGGDKNRGKV